ncbi:MAG: cysteine synthase A [Coriobacteriia bacterium]|nr:cysteine synthase A [Coriobacteriia bacterium]
MKQYGESVSGIIGGTPVVALQRLAEGLPGRVIVKLESHNPGGSVKDRIGKSMIDDAERRGLIRPYESTIVEPTSGNTGVALAMIGAERGYRVILAMPESMSIERRKLLAAFGAELVLTPKEAGMRGAVEAAESIAAKTPGSWVAGQFTNPANPRAHYETTGPEVLAATGDVEIGAFISGVGTGGTVSGAGAYLKEHAPGVRIIAVEPAESPIIAQRLSGEELKPGPHLIQGIGANFIPDTLDLDVLDEVLHIEGPDAVEVARSLAAQEGLLVGISSGANVKAAIEVASRPEMEGRAVVTVAPSTGERYLSTVLWEGLGQ